MNARSRLPERGRDLARRSGAAPHAEAAQLGLQLVGERSDRGGVWRASGESRLAPCDRWRPSAAGARGTRGAPSPPGSPSSCSPSRLRSRPGRSTLDNGAVGESARGYSLHRRAPALGSAARDRLPAQRDADRGRARLPGRGRRRQAARRHAQRRGDRPASSRPTATRRSSSSTLGDILASSGARQDPLRRRARIPGSRSRRPATSARARPATTP